MVGSLNHLRPRLRRRPGQRAAGPVRPDRRRRPALKTYSGGMRRRLDLAAALVARPDGPLPRRAHHRARPPEPQRPVGGHREPGRRGDHRAAHHPVPRGGRPPGQHPGRARPRPRHRRGHARPSSRPTSGPPSSRSGWHASTTPAGRPSCSAPSGPTPRRSTARWSRSPSTTGRGRPWPASGRSTRTASSPPPSPCASPASTTCSWPSPAAGPRTRPRTPSDPERATGQAPEATAADRGHAHRHRRAVMTTTITAPTVVGRPPLGQRRPAGLRWAVADTLTITKRNLLAVTRIPEALFFSTVQPIMFVLLFRYVFGGAINVPGDQLRQLPDAGHLRPDGGLRRRQHQHRPGRGPAEGAHRAVPGPAHGPLGRAGRPDHGRPRPQRLRGHHHHRRRVRRRVPPDHRRAPLPGRHPAHPAVRLRPLVGVRGHRAVGPQQRDGPGHVVPHPLPPDLRLVGLRPGHVDAQLAAGLRHLPAGQRHRQRLPGPHAGRAHGIVGHPDPGLDRRAS